MPGVVLDVDTSALCSAGSVTIIPATTLSLSVQPLNHQPCISGPGCWRTGYYLHLSEGCKYSRVSGYSYFSIKPSSSLLWGYWLLALQTYQEMCKLAPTLPLTLVFFFFLFSFASLNSENSLCDNQKKKFSMFISQPQLLLFYLMNPFTIRSCEWGFFVCLFFQSIYDNCPGAKDQSLSVDESSRGLTWENEKYMLFIISCYSSSLFITSFPEKDVWQLSYI